MNRIYEFLPFSLSLKLLKKHPYASPLELLERTVYFPISIVTMCFLSTKLSPSFSFSIFWKASPIIFWGEYGYLLCLFFVLSIKISPPHAVCVSLNYGEWTCTVILTWFSFFSALLNDMCSQTIMGLFFPGISLRGPKTTRGKEVHMLFS